MKIWKRNAIIASVLLLVCAGVYLNWSKAQKSTAQDLTETLSAEQVMGEDTLVVTDSESVPQEAVCRLRFVRRGCDCRSNSPFSLRSKLTPQFTSSIICSGALRTTCSTALRSLI